MSEHFICAACASTFGRASNAPTYTSWGEPICAKCAPTPSKSGWRECDRCSDVYDETDLCLFQNGLIMCVDCADEWMREQDEEPTRDRNTAEYADYARESKR